MRHIRAGALGLVLGLAGLAPTAAPAAEAAPHLWSPAELAPQIERAARRTSFADLERFGLRAMATPGRAGLDQLNHVAWLLLNQSDAQRFRLWNGRLLARASAAGDSRYVAIARLNELRCRFDEGDAAADPLIRQAATAQTDWMARMHAMTILGYVLVRDDQIGLALRTLSDADTLAPRDDPYRAVARSRIWEIESLALMDLDDLDGGAMAAGRSQFEMSPPAYPRPDFDGLYNMASLAARLGRLDLAQGLADAHHRLALRTDMASLRVWDRNLCATVEEARHAPAAVLKCLEGLGADLGPARFLAPKLLPARAIANAQLGRVAEAERDLARLERLEASKAYGASQFQRLPLVRAEVLRAKGQLAEAYQALANYSDGRATHSAEHFGSGIRQLTSVMERQLSARREQLATAKRNALLQQAVIKSQGTIVLIGGLLGALILGALFWQARLARQLGHARRTAEMANVAKSEFLANMSHEIRTPLNGVVAVAEMLSRADLRPREHEMVEIIRSSGDTLQRLLSDILDLARIESGKITIESAPFHLGDMVRAAAALSQLRCDEKGVRLNVSVAPELEATVEGDLVRVRQVLTNFLSNAVKFTDQGQIDLSAESLPPAAGGRGGVRFTVRDTGVGFERNAKTRVLARFQQADSSITRRFGGTGLGLSICRELAGLMGGMIDCDSTPGEGSRFWMDLPLVPLAPAQAGDAQAGAAQEAAPDTVAEDGGEETQGRPLRILVADDHPTNRKVVALMLSGPLFELTYAEDGRQALEALAAADYDVVLMDMQMPVMDGLTAVRELRRLEAARPEAWRTPVIMLTANALPDHIAQALLAGADLHLAKPLTAAMLFSAIDTVLSQQPCETEAAA